MDTKERDALIAKLLEEGVGLSDVQKTLESEHDVKITYMELRLIAADLKVTWEKQDAVKSKEPKKKPAADGAIPEGMPGQDPSAFNDDPALDGDLDGELLPDDEAAAIGGGTTTVTISKIVRPGAVVSGDVTFKSGITADWYVDQMGRLGLNPAGDAQPSQDDIADFQAELQRMIQSGAMG